MKKYARRLLYEEGTRRRRVRLRLSGALETEHIQNPRSSRHPSWPSLNVNMVPLIDNDEADAGEISEELPADRGEVDSQTQ